MKTSKYTVERNLKDGTVIAAGTSCTVAFDDKAPHVALVTLTSGPHAGKVVRHAAKNLATIGLTGFKKTPSLRTLEKYAMDSVCASITGGRCEPDGYSADGAPSWLLALGLI